MGGLRRGQGVPGGKTTNQLVVATGRSLGVWLDAEDSASSKAKSTRESRDPGRSWRRPPMSPGL